MGVFMGFWNFLNRPAWYLREKLPYFCWMIPLIFSAFFLYRIVSAFLPLKPRRGWNILLFVVLGGVTGMVIWVGDNNLLFTLPVFFAVLLACSRGNMTGRVALTAIFFCLIMPVNALLDTYVEEMLRAFSGPYEDLLYGILVRLSRPAIWGALYLAFRKRLPDRPPRLSPRLWKLVLLLSAMPLSSMLAVVLATQDKYDSPALHAVTMTLGLAVLPFVLLTALALLYAVLVLADHERLEQANHLASLRESYYQGLRREERQLRTLRHDLRNHLTAIRGLAAQGETGKALEYIDQLSASPALRGGRRLCENDAANAVLSAKAEAMRQSGLRLELAVSLPKDLPIAGVDLCALLGNALDNAMEAAEKAEDKSVSLRCRVERGLFMLRVENAYAGTISPDLSTTKPDRASHGFGLAGMREIAERLGGSLEVRAENGWFQLVVGLPLAP